MKGAILYNQSPLILDKFKFVMMVIERKIDLVKIKFAVSNTEKVK